MNRKKRATAILVRNQGILLSRMKGSKTWLLPGGGINAHETPEQAVIREFDEETCLNGTAQFLFTHASYTQDHIVYQMYADGEPRSCGEIADIAYYRSGSRFSGRMSAGTKGIIDRFIAPSRPNRGETAAIGRKQNLEIQAPSARSPSSVPPAYRRPPVFIIHGGHTKSRDQLELLLWRSGYRPVVVEHMPPLGAAVDDLVQDYLQKCVFVVALLDKERTIKQDDKLMPRQNVIFELGLARHTHPKRQCVLKEAGVDLPGDLAPMVYHEFKDGNIESLFLTIVTALTTSKVRPAEEDDLLEPPPERTSHAY